MKNHENFSLHEKTMTDINAKRTQMLKLSQRYLRQLLYTCSKELQTIFFFFLKTQKNKVTAKTQDIKNQNEISELKTPITELKKKNLQNELNSKIEMTEETVGELEHKSQSIQSKQREAKSKTDKQDPKHL